MPYVVLKKGSGYKVCKKNSNKCFSKSPLSKSQAVKQQKALYANESMISFKEFYEQQLQGGKADDMSIDDMARKHNTTPEAIKQAIEDGVKVEMEHTSDSGVAREIATDHVAETGPTYYKRLKKAKL